VGGDDFKLKAVVKHTDGSELASIESALLTVWRSVSFDRIYEMDGETHVSTNATEAKIRPYFDPAFVEYNAGAVNQIDVPKSVKYIGLWKNDAPYQLDWATIQSKLPAETPTMTELTDAAGPAGPARAAARTAITAKAQAWVDRIDTAFSTSRSQWKANGGIAANSIVAIKYYHPKYSSGGGDFATNEWPAWVRVTTFGGNYPNRDPDGMWPANGSDFAGLSMGNGIISIPKGLPNGDVEIATSHEAGHATKNSFKRDVFGPILDHSIAAGLMDLRATMPPFSGDEKKILRGINP